MADKLKKKIAILDDEPYVCDFLSKLLASSGYETFTATDGQHGLNLINREHPDLIILDLIMPGLSGYALLDILNAKGSRIPVLVMSSMSNISDNLAHQGIAGLLIKPIDEERLLIHVDCIFKLEDAAKYEGTIAGTKTSEEETGAEESEPSSEKTKSEAKAADLDATEEAEPSPAEALPETETPGTPAGEEAPLVLIVEDEPDMQMILSRLLEHHGFRVEVAGDGPLGLEMAQKLSPDVMILDLMLPKMDGFQVCRLLKFNDKYRHIPIVILTARSLRTDRELAEASGADAYLVKPFEVETLMKTLKDAMAHGENRFSLRP